MKFRIGQDVLTTQDIEIGACATIVNKGERGEIVDIDPEDGSITLQLRRYSEALSDWRNMIFVKDPVKMLRHYQAPYRISIIGTIAACVIAFMVGWFNEPPLAAAKHQHASCVVPDSLQPDH